MQAITVHDRAAGIDGLALTEMPYPHLPPHDTLTTMRVSLPTSAKVNKEKANKSGLMTV